jgi:hypothetical protein
VVTGFRAKKQVEKKIKNPAHMCEWRRKNLHSYETDLIYDTPDGKMRTIKAEKPHLWEEGKAGVLFLASRMASALPAEAIKDTNLH